MSGNGMRATLGVSLWGGQQRGVAANSQTLAFRAPVPVVPRRIGNARQLFVGAYDRFRDKCKAIDEPGVAVIAVDEATGAAAGSVRLLARVGRPVAAIVGRHDRCDLYLQGHERLSLRHLAVVVDPVISWERGRAAVRYHLLDLRTSEAMIDEDGRPLRGLVAEGPAIIRCAGYVLYCLPVGDPTDWPTDGADAWSMLPERVYLDELELAEGSLPKIRMPRRDARETYVTRTGGPRDTSMRLATGPIAGILEVSTPHRQLSLSIGEDALKAGILLGRYGRCDAMEAAVEDESLSRVHALMIQLADRVLLVDTASTNGTFEKGQPARLVTLDGTTELRLGKRTFARWLPAP